MGLSEPRVMTGTVMHSRLFPARNIFNYGIYYIALPLTQPKPPALPFNCPGLLSFHEKDHGLCDGSPLLPWIRDILNRYQITQADGEIVLISLPRVCGYVFNPVSFWLCYDRAGGLRAALCEVHNTFGERHSYLCAHTDRRVIQKSDTLEAAKVFHVSPFLEREGHYRFVFDVSEDAMKIQIDYFDAHGKKKLVTSLSGHFEPLSRAALRKAFWRYPLVTIRAITLIHWQALKIIWKGMRYIRRPLQKAETVTTTENLT